MWIRRTLLTARTMTNETVGTGRREPTEGDKKVLRTYEACDKNANRAAEMLGIQRTTLLNILRRIGIEHTAGVPAQSVPSPDPCSTMENAR